MYHNGKRRSCVMDESLYIRIGERIRQARGTEPQEGLANHLGYSIAQISRIESGKRRISLEDLRKVAEYFRKPLSYFIDDLDGLKLDPKFSEVMTAMDLTVLPVYGNVNAGHPAFVMERPEEYVTVPRDIVGQSRFAIRVRGDSMIGLDIRDGDLLFVRPQDDADDGDIVVARVNGEEYTVKRLRKRHGKPPVLESANPDYPLIVGEDVRIVGKVVGQFRMM